MLQLEKVNRTIRLHEATTTTTALYARLEKQSNYTEQLL